MAKKTTRTIRAALNQPLILTVLKNIIVAAEPNTQITAKMIPMFTLLFLYEGATASRYAGSILFFLAAAVFP